MGKHSGRKKRSGSQEGSGRHSSPKSFDEDTAMFITMAQELKDEGNKFFQRRDHEAALLKYEKAIKLLPRNHIDVALLRSNMAACYMQVGLSEYPMAINECNMALEVHPRYSKALLKRAKCYEALNRLDLAYRDVDVVLNIEPNNLTALEIAGRVKSALEKKGIMIDDNGFTLAPEYTEIPCLPPPVKMAREKRKKKHHKAIDEKKIEDKVVVEEKKKQLVPEESSNKVEENFDKVDKSKVEKTLDNAKEEKAQRTVKLVLGEDIRCAQLPVQCSIKTLVETVQNRYTNLKDFLIKYKDQEGDLITITSNEELRWAEASIEQQGSLKLYIVGVDPGQEQLLQKVKRNILQTCNSGKGKKTEHGSFYIDDWIVQFAMVFKNHVGFNSDAYLDLHELGMKLYSDAMEETVTCEEAQELFEISADKFQEMAALALFNWGNVHMSKARKRVSLTDDASREDILAQVKTAYEWAQKEFLKAGMRYQEALNIKEEFYEAYLALGQQQFEQARLSWYYTIASQLDLGTSPSMEILQLFNNAENNMERGMQMWEEMEENRQNDSSTPDKLTTHLQKMGLDGLSKDITSGEAAEQAGNMRSQVNLLWGTILYERSVVEYKLELPSWEECLEFAVEKFELAGASATDIAVMIKNHCANQTVVEGLGFKIDEIVQAWNEMYDAKRWKRGVPSFRLEPLFRRRVPNLHHVLERV